jgi:hypothetical protein
MRRIFVLFLTWKSFRYYIFQVCVCSLCYPACKGHAPYCHPWPLLRYFIAPYYHTHGTILGKCIERENCVLIFFTTFAGFHIRINWRDIINEHRSSCKVTVTLVGFTQQTFQKLFKCKISWKSVLWEPSSSTRADMTKLIVSFRNFANALRD